MEMEMGNTPLRLLLEHLQSYAKPLDLEVIGDGH